jgi:hypothetical protein
MILFFHFLSCSSFGNDKIFLNDGMSCKKRNGCQQGFASSLGFNGMGYYRGQIGVWGRLSLKNFQFRMPEPICLLGFVGI